jgi:hypothetical protein
VLARVGFYFAAIQHHSPQLHRPRLQRDLQHLVKQPLQGRQMQLPKIRNGPEIGFIPRRQHPEAYIFHQLLLHPARRKYPYAVAIEQNPGHHPWMIRRLSALFFLIDGFDRAQIDRPHPRQNALSDSPATNRAGSEAIADLAQADKPGKLWPCCQTGISFL